MEITAITSQKKRKDRVNIFIDGSFAFALDHETLLKNHLKVGQNILQTDIDRLIKEGEYAYWYNSVLQLISRRPRSQREITDYLNRKQTGDMVQEKILTKLKNAKFIDDTAFAKWFVDQRQQFRPKGKKALTQELRQKGIADAIITEVLNSESIDEIALARKIAEKKKRLLTRYPPDKQREKLISFLCRRGFSWETIERVL